MKVLISSLILLWGASSFASQSTRTCFRESAVRGWKAVNHRTMDVRTRGRHIYRLELSYCPDLNWNVIEFDSFGGFDRVCKGDSINVYDQFDMRLIDRCHIWKIEQIE